MRDALAACSRERRQETLATMPRRVRAALLLHMESQSAEGAALARAEHADAAGETSSEASSSTDEADQELLPIEDATAALDDGVASSADGDSSAAGEGQELAPEAPAGTAGSGACGRPSRTCYRGVVHNMCARGSSYQAIVQFANMYMVTRAARTLERALEYHSLLVSIKQQALDADSSIAIGDRIRSAVDAVCRENATSTTELGLAFRAVVPVWNILRRKITGRFSCELADVLRHREMLLNAKETGWGAVREAWVQIMQMPVVRRTSAWGFARSVPKSTEEAAAIVDAAWEASRQHRHRTALRKRRREECQEARARRRRESQQRAAAKHVLRCARAERRARRWERRRLCEKTAEQRLDRRLQQAVAAVQRALLAEDRARARASAALARQEAARARQAHALALARARAAKWLRKAHRRWGCDPRRTMGEILRGCPARNDAEV